MMLFLGSKFPGKFFSSSVYFHTFCNKHIFCDQEGNFFFFWPRQVACGILVLQPGIEPMPSAVKVQSPNHWTAREFPENVIFKKDMWLCLRWHCPLKSQVTSTRWKPVVILFWTNVCKQHCDSSQGIAKRSGTHFFTLEGHTVDGERRLTHFTSTYMELTLQSPQLLIKASFSEAVKTSCLNVWALDSELLGSNLTSSLNSCVTLDTLFDLSVLWLPRP